MNKFSLLISFWLRGGGAGGGHSHGGSGFGGSSGYGGDGGRGGSAGLFDLVFLLLRLGPVGWIVLAIVGYIVFRLLMAKRTDAENGPLYDPDQLPAPYVPPAREAVDLGVLDGEPLASFQNKVAKAFFTVQVAWTQKRVDLMRRFISDGVYQRFHAQFTMMNLLSQSNPITDVHISDIQIVKTVVEGSYQCVDVEIRASATDQFVSERFPELNSPGGHETFSEFWSFVRRIDHRRGQDIFHSDICPKCSAPVTEKLMETARCPYCGTYINSGEYDWVLSEITQSGDYGRPLTELWPLPKSPASAERAPGLESLDTPLAEVRAAYPAFAQHVLEDRASNAFMQVLIGLATRNLQAIQKFTTADLHRSLTQAMPSHSFVYDRLYTRAVELLSLQLRGDQLRACVAIEYDFRQVDLTGTTRVKLQVPDEMISDTKVLVLMRTLSDITLKGSVYAGSCPQCGAAIKDSIDVACTYCGAVLNDSKLDWIVEQVLDIHTYLNAK